jgi:hypothetical protein
MPEVVGVSVVWWLLATPPVLITLIYAVRRTRIWLLILAFSWGVAGSSTAESFYDIVFAKRFDQKFAHAPDVALELSIFGAAAFSLLGLVLFGCTLALSIKKERRAIAPVYLPAIFGGLYMSVPWLMYWSHGDIEAPFFWSWMLLVPVASALVVVRPVRTAGIFPSPLTRDS